MERVEVIEALCMIASKVGAHFDHEHAHDCFCRGGQVPAFQFSRAIIDFINEAVDERIARKYGAQRHAYVIVWYPKTGFPLYWTGRNDWSPGHVNAQRFHKRQGAEDAISTLHLDGDGYGEVVVQCLGE